MAAKLYEITMFDTNGKEVGEGPVEYTPMRTDTPRELQFMELAYSEEGVARYKVRHLRPHEVKKVVRDYRRQARRQRIEEIMDDIVERLSLKPEEILRMYGLDNEIEREI